MVLGGVSLVPTGNETALTPQRVPDTRVYTLRATPYPH